MEITHGPVTLTVPPGFKGEELIVRPDSKGVTIDLQRFAAAIRKEALEAAAKACEALDVRCSLCGGHDEHEVCDSPRQEDYAAAIRALSDQAPS